jgi:hypothetical protein
MKVRYLLAGLLIVTAGQLGANERLTLRVSPSVAFAPANLVVRTMIVADKDNRAIEIVAESPNFYRSSEMQLDGERAPHTTTFEFRSLPSGTYEVRATLKGSGGHQLAYAEHKVNVVDTGVAGR